MYISQGNPLKQAQCVGFLAFRTPVGSVGFKVLELSCESLSGCRRGRITVHKEKENNVLSIYTTFVLVCI